MRHVSTETHEVERYLGTYCDVCLKGWWVENGEWYKLDEVTGKPVYKSNDTTYPTRKSSIEWKDGYYTGQVLSMTGQYQELSVDICPECMREHVIPLLEEIVKAPGSILKNGWF